MLSRRLAAMAVERLLALRPQVHHPDFDLLAVCAEFRASETALERICEAGPELSDKDRDALIVPICASWDGMLNRMAKLRATASEGLAARALALAQHSGIKPGSTRYAFEFEPGDSGGITGRLLHMLLTDAVAMCSTPLRSLDADLLALRPEFDRLHALMVAYNNDLILDGSTECADFDALCERIAVTPPAIGADGRAFQAAAAMHHLYYHLNDEQQARNPAWLMLKELAGDAYRWSRRGHNGAGSPFTAGCIRHS